MVNIIEWLLKIEHQAGKLYEKSADYFKEDENLKLFLKQLAEDEAWHYHIMGSAAEHYRKYPKFTTTVIVDKEIEDRISGLFNILCEHLNAGSLTKTILHDSIISAEFSEWNDIFLYVVNSLKNDFKEFSYIGSKIQHHKRKIELFYDSNTDSIELLKTFKKLNPVWKERILIVDDEEPIVELLEAILEEEGIIDKAFNGTDALEKVEKNYYQLIICDIDMPGMDGFVFFEKAGELYPDLNERFLFFSGQITSDRISYFNKKNVDYMMKPARMNLIKEKAIQILLKDEFSPLKS